MIHYRAYKGVAWAYGSKTGKIWFLGVDGKWHEQPLSLNSGRHFKFGFNGKNYLVHRFAWFIVTGKWPREHIDHIDRNGLNNSLDNLREATNSVNMHNSGLRVDNISGHKGVSWCKHFSKWQARINVASKTHRGPYRETIEEAIQDRKDLEAQFQNIIQLPNKTA